MCDTIELNSQKLKLEVCEEVNMEKCETVKEKECSPVKRDQCENILEEVCKELADNSFQLFQPRWRTWCARRRLR